MPIYEFYCPRCHAVFSFWSRSVNTEKVPRCPRHGRHRMQRRVSGFAVGGRSADAGDGGRDAPGGDPPVDEARLERAMEGLAAEAEGVDEDDPRSAARLMRRLSQSAGLRFGEGMEEALRRMEAGDDPEAVEAEMGDLLEGEGQPFVQPESGSGSGAGSRGGRDERPGRRAGPPERDDTLYEM